MHACLWTSAQHGAYGMQGDSLLLHGPLHWVQGASALCLEHLCPLSALILVATGLFLSHLPLFLDSVQFFILSQIHYHGGATNVTHVSVLSSDDSLLELAGIVSDLTVPGQFMQSPPLQTHHYQNLDMLAQYRILKEECNWLLLITCAEETDPSLTTISFHVVIKSNNVSPESSLFQT